MALTPEDLEQIKGIITPLIDGVKTELTDKITQGDRGVAASLKDTLKGKITEIEEKLNDTGKGEKEGEGKGKEGDKESPAMVAMRKQLEELTAENTRSKERARIAETQDKIDQALAGQPVNPDVRKDLINKLYSEWKDNLTEDNGTIFLKSGSDFQELTNATKEFLGTSRGSIYLTKPAISGTGKKSEDANGKGKGKEGEETLDSLLLTGIGELFEG